MDGGKITGTINRPLMSTAFHYNHCNIMARVARLLGKQDDAQYFSDLAEKTAKGFHGRFFDPDTNAYESQTQLSYLLPLAFFLTASKGVIDNFIEAAHKSIHDWGYLATGKSRKMPPLGNRHPCQHHGLRLCPSANQRHRDRKRSRRAECARRTVPASGKGEHCLYRGFRKTPFYFVVNGRLDTLEGF